jgi:UDP-glucuronate 4-epimerase
LIFGDKKPGDVEITCANIEKAGNLLGYNPQVSFEQGIKKFVDWYTLQNEYK